MTPTSESQCEGYLEKFFVIGGQHSTGPGGRNPVKRVNMADDKTWKRHIVILHKF